MYEPEGGERKERKRRGCETRVNKSETEKP